MLNSSKIERILVVTAHPDDVDFCASGTVTKFCAQGIEVHYCICTNGDAGGFDPTVPRHDIPRIRQKEQIKAAQIIGVDQENVHFLNYPDGRLYPTIELRRDISRVIRKVRPQLVICQSPERDYNNIVTSHPDHLAAGEAAICAVYPDAQNPFAHPELAAEEWEAWNVLETWVIGGNPPNHIVDITDVYDKKIAAILAHTSQTEHQNQDYFHKALDEWHTELVKQTGINKGRYLESFRIVNTG